ncbi:hypothetical protein P170DRAFT_272413 [Aspergillus steynii IBT 23096]|uniref:Uncharacterized protein n=1 Tax=Aspergillus steynii IBT 23096 TaxID=1392250 RepID=A0A2I2FWT2_9EURO|nr:uncharacterized protein P170DRAFT_272413 [Aspergillus steynii IBT 23096]PLB45099.1 hypothetical protein P170DRAFT_272413 [Aspergillus steynii IBT 23096]
MPELLWFYCLQLLRLPRQGTLDPASPPGQVSHMTGLVGIRDLQLERFFSLIHHRGSIGAVVNAKSQTLRHANRPMHLPLTSQSQTDFA